MAHAMEKLRPDLILQIDADLQHSPNMIPVFIDLARNGFSLVIGSRFVFEGSTPNFYFYRRLISSIGNWLLRFFGEMPAIRDCTSGFRCIQRELLKKCDLTYLSTRGYSFQSSLLYSLILNNPKVIQVPIVFPDRKKGESKLDFGDQVEFLLNVFKIRFCKSEEFIKFWIVGVSGVIVNLGLYLLFTRKMGIFLEFASPIAVESSILWNFMLNKVITFHNRNSQSSLKQRLMRFHASAGLCGVVNYSSLLLFTRGIGLWDVASNIIGIGFGIFINYFLNSRWKWREKL